MLFLRVTLLEVIHFGSEVPDTTDLGASCPELKG
jgi:hypothetical protein